MKKIRGISALDEMTDAFLERRVTESLVEPLAIPFDQVTRKLRTEQFDGSELPFDQFGKPGRVYQKQVARLSIPFTGDPTLLKYAPSPCGMNFPQGEVYDKTIQFDVILWGSRDDTRPIEDEFHKNCDLIATYAGCINKQVKEFNESLPVEVKAAFTTKLEEPTKQHSIFDELGIAEEAEPPPAPTSPPAPQPKKGNARAVQIIPIIDRMYVNHLSQINNNFGDVNNAIQSN